MSWINSNATYKQNSKNDLSFYHGFSKTPVEPTSTGTAATTLANASTKGGHTVIGTEVWAEEIPWFGLVASRAAAVTRLSGLTKLNDLVKVDGEGGKVYKYIGADDAVFTEEEWSSFWTEVTLTNGMVLNNRHNQPVLRYYLNQPMQTLTTTNNASIDSKGFATRLFVNEENHTGQTSGGSVISQFAAGTDNIKNGIPSVELNPKLYLGTTEKIAGTHYYDYNVSGTILWSTAVTSSSPKISCFRYIGKTVTGQLSTVESTISSHAIDISEIKAQLGMGDSTTGGTQSVTSRVETVEDVVRVLLGLGDSDAIAATESIATTANTAATTAISGALEESGSIAQAIADAEVRVKVTTDALQGAIDTLNGTETTTGSVAKAVADAEVRVKVTTDALAGRIAALEGVKLSVQVVDALPEVPVINTIYLVPEEDKTSGNYVEYIAYKPEGSETVTTERIGTTAVDLEGYTTDAEHTALADRVTALDSETGRVAVVEGKVSTLEGQVSTLTTETIPDIQKSVTDGVSEAKTYAEGQASAAQTAATNAASQALATARGEITQEIAAAKSGAESTAAGELSAAVEQIGKDIATAKQEAIDSAKVTLTNGTGIVIPNSGTAQTSFEISVDTEVIATVAALEALTKTVTDNNTTITGITTGLDTRLQAAEATITSLTSGDASVDAKISAAVETLEGEISGAVESLEGQISQAQSTLQGNIDGVSGRVTTLETVTVPEVKTIAEQGVADAAAALAEAQAKVASVTLGGTKPEGLSLGSDAKNPVLTVSTAMWDKDADGVADGKSFMGTDGRLITAGTALNVAQSVANDVKSQSLYQTGTLDNMFSVATDGSVGTGITSITITDTGLSTAISGARTGAVADVKAMTLSATDTDDTGKVTVTLGGTVETPTLTVTSSDIASATTLSDLVNTVNEHIEKAAGLYLSVEKVDVLPADAAAEKNKIYLVPVDTEAGREQNVHTEYIWTNGKWEIIGTTAIDINSLEAATETAQSTADTALANAATAQAAAEAAQTAADKAQGEVDALEEVVATKANASEVISSISDGKGTTVTGAITVKDGRETVYEDDLWGTTATMSENGVLSFAHNWIRTSGDTWNTSITKVEDNKAYVGNDVFANIQTERIKDGSYMFQYAPITSFNGDLSSLVNGCCMFGGTFINSFDGDLSSLVNGVEMFLNTGLNSFNGDLSSLVYCSGMFRYTNITSFNGDLSSLVDGSQMFNGSKVNSFNGDLSSLVDGSSMFSYTQLTSFNGDLSSLVDGSQMFYITNLDMESLETICDTLPNKSDLNTWNDTTKTYEEWDGNSYFVYPIIRIDDNCKKVQGAGYI